MIESPRIIGPIEAVPARFTYDGESYHDGFWYLTLEWYGKHAHKSLGEAWYWQATHA